MSQQISVRSQAISRSLRDRPSESRLTWLALVAMMLASVGLASMAKASGIDPASVLKEVSFALERDPPQLNSMKATDQQSFFVLGHVMEGLTRYGKSGDIVPGVAEKWEITDKGATFHLRKDAVWSDGKPVTAQDFVFGWRTALEPKTASEYAFILYPLKNALAVNTGKASSSTLGVQATDVHTLKIAFEKPCGYFLSLTAFPTYLPLREDFYKARASRYGASAADLLYNGPFVLSRWVQGASITMDKSPRYWNRGKIALDRISIPYITADNGARFNFFKDRKTDLLERLNKEDLDKAMSGRYGMKSFADGTLYYIEFNDRLGKVTSNKKLRQAMKLVIDADQFVAKVVGIPGTRPGRGLIPGWVRGAKATFRSEYPIAATKPDLARAKQLLEEAKKDLGISRIPPLTWITVDTPLAAKEAEYFQGLFQRTLGLELRIDKQIFKQKLAKMRNGDFDIASAAWGPDYPDAMTFADLATSWNENNHGKYFNPEYDRLIRAAQATSDPVGRLSAMAAAERLLLDEAAIIPTYERTTVYLVNERLEGVVRNVVGPDPDFTYAKVVK